VACSAFSSRGSGAPEARVRGAPVAFGASTSAAAASAADVAAARVPSLIRVWALRKAELVRQSHTEKDAMRNDAAAVRTLRTVVRARGGADAAAHLPSVGTLFGAGHAAPTGASVAGPAIAMAGEVQLPQRGHLNRLLCRFCLRYACRLHGARDGDPLAVPLPPRPVGLPRGADGADADGLELSPQSTWGNSAVAPVAPRAGVGALFSAYFDWAEAKGLHVGPTVELRVCSAVADARQTDIGPDAGCRGRPQVSTVVDKSVAVAPRDGDVAGRFVGGTRRATAGGTGSPAISNAVGASVGDGSAVVVGTSSAKGDADALRPPTTHAEDVEVARVDDVWQRPSLSSLWRGRRARVHHSAIALATIGCFECRLDPRVRAVMRSVPRAVGGWRIDQVRLLQMGADTVGVQDTCRLARFVAGKTCRRVAKFLEGPGLSLLCATPVKQPMQDPGLEAVGSSEATAGSCAGGLDEDSGGSATASQCSPAPHCSLGSSGASRRLGTTNSQDDPCAPDKVHDFAPCFHSGECTEERCRCARTGLACEKTCGCAQYRWTAGSPSSAGLGSAHSIGDSFPAPGSRLSGRHIWRACVPPSRCDTDECPCFAVDRECDPDACHTCGAHWHPSTGVDGVPHSPDDGVHRAGAQVLRGAGLLIAADVESGVSLPEAL